MAEVKVKRSGLKVGNCYKVTDFTRRVGRPEDPLLYSSLPGEYVGKYIETKMFDGAKEIPILDEVGAINKTIYTLNNPHTVKAYFNDNGKLNVISYADRTCFIETPCTRGVEFELPPNHIHVPKIGKCYSMARVSSVPTLPSLTEQMARHIVSLNRTKFVPMPQGEQIFYTRELPVYMGKLVKVRDATMEWSGEYIAYFDLNGVITKTRFDEHFTLKAFYEVPCSRPTNANRAAKTSVLEELRSKPPVSVFPGGINYPRNRT